jgi:hypothetical protein
MNEPIELLSDDDSSNTAVDNISINISVNWKVANCLSDIGNQKQILGDGNCGYRALIEGLKIKKLIEEEDDNVCAINAFGLRKKMHDFAESHASWFMDGDEKRVDGKWLAYSCDYFQKSLKKIWDEETLGKYTTVRKVTTEHWFEGVFCFVIASLLFKTSIIVYHDNELRSTRNRSNALCRGQTKFETHAYIFHEDRVYVDTIKKINFPIEGAICLYYSRNHYEYVNLKDNFSRSEVRFVDLKTARQDDIEVDNHSTNNDINFDAINPDDPSIPPPDEKPRQDITEVDNT